MREGSSPLFLWLALQAISACTFGGCFNEQLLYLQVVVSDACDKALLEAAHHQEDGEDNVGEEGDEVGQFSV